MRIRVLEGSNAEALAEALHSEQFLWTKGQVTLQAAGDVDEMAVYSFVSEMLYTQLILDVRKWCISTKSRVRVEFEVKGGR